MREREREPPRNHRAISREPRRRHHSGSRRERGDKSSTATKRARDDAAGVVQDTPATGDFHAWQNDHQVPRSANQQGAAPSDAPKAGNAVDSADPLASSPSGSGTSGGGVDMYGNLQELLRRIIALEFSERCSQRSIAVLLTICDTMCTEPMALVKVMEVLDQCFSEAVRAQQQSLLLNYWFILDAVLKRFRDHPAMLNAVVVALPHLIQQYLPWKGSSLARESWMERDRDRGRYEGMFPTWERVVPKALLDEVKLLWEDDDGGGGGGARGAAGEISN